MKKNQPVNPGQNGNPGGNSGNGGNGGNGITDRTPVNPNPSVTSTPTNPGSVLGEDRPVPVEKASSTEGEASPVQEGKDGAVLGAERTRRKGAVLGAERERNGNALNKRSAVSTGDAHFAGLWASLSALSLLSLAGYVVVRKKEV